MTSKHCLHWRHTTYIYTQILDEILGNSIKLENHFVFNLDHSPCREFRIRLNSLLENVCSFRGKKTHQSFFGWAGLRIGIASTTQNDILVVQICQQTFFSLSCTYFKCRNVVKFWLLRASSFALSDRNHLPLTGIIFVEQHFLFIFFVVVVSNNYMKRRIVTAKLLIQMDSPLISIVWRFLCVLCYYDESIYCIIPSLSLFLSANEAGLFGINFISVVMCCEYWSTDGANGKRLARQRYNICRYQHTNCNKAMAINQN